MTATLPTPLQRTIAGLSLALALALAQPALAAPPPIGVPLRVGLVGGVQLTSSEFDVVGERTTAAQPETAGLFGLRLGWRAARVLGVEVGAYLAPAATVGGGSAMLLPIHADLVVRPLPGQVEPYAAAGAGVYTLVGGDAGRDADALFRLAAGVEWTIERAVALRLEAAVIATDGVSEAMSFSPTLTLGVDLLGWRERGGDSANDDDDLPPAPPLFTPTAGDEGDDDLDDDGLDDDDDACPAHAGLEDHDGCPDSDADGLRDAFDECPTARGSSALRGCPDGDRDGTTDRWDACPNRPGPADRFGCPAARPKPEILE